MLLIETTGIIEWGGLFIIAALVFAETGLLLGLAIPGGETLVFTAGLLVSTNTLETSIYVLVPLLIAMAIAGDLSGYYIGRKFGKRLHEKEDTWYYRKKYFEIAKDYLDRHSKLALILGKFLPVIRPFTPVVSGMTGVPTQRFIPLSVIASITYITTFSVAGHFLGQRFPVIKEYLIWILPVSIILAIGIMYSQARSYNRSHRKRKN
ncbi:DedA family protein [Aridibaculum aurantiacum]|uniref:DedA family protein n=1 Tax=Aridibaculum aurantiacum TaxID=2810307 RepID=UPI001A9601C9|nr:VTT domain-containing protein [Aridibaculum aurantiacum]